MLLAQCSLFALCIWIICSWMCCEFQWTSCDFLSSSNSWCVEWDESCRLLCVFSSGKWKSRHCSDRYFVQSLWFSAPLDAVFKDTRLLWQNEFTEFSPEEQLRLCLLYLCWSVCIVRFSEMCMTRILRHCWVTSAKISIQTKLTIYFVLPFKHITVGKTTAMNVVILKKQTIKD